VFESRPGHNYTEAYLCFLQSLHTLVGIESQVRPRPLPSIFFPINFSLIFMICSFYRKLKELKSRMETCVKAIEMGSLLLVP
jgi:hypothetical protein